MSIKRITIGFSSHHIEVLPFMRCQMERHHTIIFEEPPSALFPEMLAGLIPVEDYLMEADSQFPQFDCQMCGLIREMHREGKQILQVEPYLETLIRIHELLAAGKTKEDVKAMPALKEVYEAESMASGALITFYSTSMRAPFADVVEAVKAFAKTDANRLRLREDLRARAIASMAESFDSIFIESGIHPLSPLLLSPAGTWLPAKGQGRLPDAPGRQGSGRETSEHGTR